LNFEIEEESGFRIALGYCCVSRNLLEMINTYLVRVAVIHQENKSFQKRRAVQIEALGSAS
jgi:hypothetical protein